MQRITWILNALFALVLSLSNLASAQSNVPIDSPRGNYEGADNIHWYQQRSLRISDHVDLPPLASNPLRCNVPNESQNCFGETQHHAQTSYIVRGNVPIIVSLFVDNRETEGFNFPFRRAIDAIRRTNDAFSRSGVNATLYISELRFFDFDGAGYNSNSSDIYDQIYTTNPELVFNTARDDQADMLIFVRNVEHRLQDSGNLCGTASVGITPAEEFLTPIAVLTCEDATSQQIFINASLVAAHEIGHVAGLVHDSGAGEDIQPHLSFGRGYVDSGTNISSIMATQGNRAPFFSSPTISVGSADTRLGVEGSTDSVLALNQSVANVALYWERRFGPLSPSANAARSGFSVSPDSTVPTIQPGMRIPEGTH